MENRMYPAIFHKDEKSYWVEFPDLPGCLTEGGTIEEAFNMAGDALFVWLSSDDTIKREPSDISTIKTDRDSLLMLVKPFPYESEEAKKYKISEAIENGLQERRFSKSQAAQILGVDRSYISHLETGRKTPSPDMAKRIGLLLDFDWHIFYEDEASAL